PQEWPRRRSIQALPGEELHLPGAINDLGLGVNQDGGSRSERKSFEATTHKRRITFVIMRGPLEEFAAGQLEYPIVVTAGTDVTLIAEVLNPGILCRKFPANHLRPIGGRVVANDQLEILVILAHQAAKGAGKVFI